MDTNEASRDRGSSQPALIEKDLSYAIIGVFFLVYNTLGFGFLESIYAKALELALRANGLLVERECPVSVYFQGHEVGRFRGDMIVERRIIIEIKSSERLSDISKRQLRNYLAASNLELGLLLHFGPRAEYHRILGPRSSPA